MCMQHLYTAGNDFLSQLMNATDGGELDDGWGH